MAGLDKTTNISWANKTWNVIVGCEKISPACKRCYAMYVANKEEQKGIKKFMGDHIDDIPSDLLIREYPN